MAARIAAVAQTTQTRAEARSGTATIAPPCRLGAAIADRLLDHEPRVADVAQPVLRIALEAAAQKPADRWPASPPAASRGRSPRAAPRRASRSPLSPANKRSAGQHLVQHDPERPDVRPLVDRHAAAPAPAPCTPPCRGSLPAASRRASASATAASVERASRARRRDRAGSIAFASPKSRTLTLPSIGRLDVLRLQIAVDDPLLVRLFERLRRSGRASSRGSQSMESSPPPSRSASVGPSTSSITSARVPPARFEPVDRGDVRVIELREELRFALEPGQPLLVRGERRRQHFDRDLALELRVGRAIDLAHPALAELGGDLVRAEATAGADHDRARWRPVRTTSPVSATTRRCPESPRRSARRCRTSRPTR